MGNGRAQVDQEVAIIGTGFAGLGMAIRLQKAGVSSFTLFEKAGSVGGTWRDNTYPGAACDIPSHLYSFSFEPNPRWSTMYGKQEEILAYLEHCASKYEIAPHIRFNTALQGARFDEATGVWTLELSDGTTTRARAVVSGTGGLSRPKRPAIEGIEDFQGSMFHSACWEHDHDLTGKRVAVIGTGASAIQIVPNLAQRVGQLHLFMRSAPWVVPKGDRPIGPREQRLYELLPPVQWLFRSALYWSHEIRALFFVKYPQVLKHIQPLAEKYLASVVADPELRAQLTPDYTIGCKRVLLANDYYPALQRDNVEVVTAGIDKITARGIVGDDGVEREVDVIVLCTGFNAADDAAPFPVSGIGGLDLAQSWRDGAEAFLGTTVSGFPNLFLLVGPNTGLGHNSMIFMIESQLNYVMSCLRTLRRRKLRYMDVRPDVQSRFNQTLHSRLAGTVWMSGCSSWYQAENGKVTTLWPGFTVEYRVRTMRVNARHYDCITR